MDPTTTVLPNPGGRLPRTRGDGPQLRAFEMQAGQAPPHTRGWTLVLKLVDRAEHGSPAHAGMDPGSYRCLNICAGLPRTRGDGPIASDSNCGSRLAPPHTRGWTVLRQGDFVRRDGSPAHAGMDRVYGQSLAHAARLPRTRGDGPLTSDRGRRLKWAPPHTRGWTRPELPVYRHRRGSPAHAGMDLAGDGVASRTHGLPRTRGDGP